MVARILTGKSIRGLINYNESKVALGTASPILANRFGLDIEQLQLKHKVARFEHLTKLNSRVKTNAVHIMLNFDKSEKMNVAKLQNIAVDYMDRIGFGDQPYLVYKHDDASHPHIHIVTTNMKADSTRIIMHNIGKSLSEDARKEIELKYNLLKAEGRGSDLGVAPVPIQLAEYGEKATKSSIYNIVTAVLRDYKFTSFAEYKAILNSFNVTADRGAEDSLMFQKKGLVYSIIDTEGRRIGIPFKASSLAGNPILAKVESKFKLSQMRRKEFIQPLRQRVSSVLDTKGVNTINDYKTALKNIGISLLLRRNDKGLLYGLTYVDHNTRCVFNGSDIGKDFSAKAVLEKLNIKGGQQAGQFREISIKGRENIKHSSSQAYDEVPSSKEALLEFLFEKPTQEPMAILSRKRKKKKKKQISRNSNLTNQI